MRQYFYTKESIGYTVRVTSESGCTSEVIAFVDSKRQAAAIVDARNNVR